jgi:hypothetical protein
VSSPHSRSDAQAPDERSSAISFEVIPVKANALPAATG